MAISQLKLFTSVPSPPLYMGSLTTYAGFGHLGPILIRNFRNPHLLHSNQRSLIQHAKTNGYLCDSSEDYNQLYPPMRSFSIRPLKTAPLIKSCPFHIAPSVYTELSRLETINVACYPAHPLEAYNVECYYSVSKHMVACVVNYRHVIVTIGSGTPEEATHTFRFTGVVCDVYTDRHLLVVRTVYEIYAAIIFSQGEKDVLMKKLSRCGQVEDLGDLFTPAEPGFYFYPLIHYVQMNRSISRVSVSQAWADIPAPHREIYICATHWDGKVKIYSSYDNMLAIIRNRRMNQESRPADPCYRPPVFLLSEFTLPQVQPYASTTTSMGYIALPRPEPLPLFSTMYPNRVYLAYGDRLFFIVLSEELNARRLSITLPADYRGEIINCSDEKRAKPSLFNIREYLCEMGERSSFTAIQHCRNNNILLADSHFLWLFSETNLVEPLLRLQHFLTTVAPIRSIQSAPLVPNDADENTALPLICIEETKASSQFISGLDFLRSFELVVIMTHAQVVSTILGVANEAAGLVLSLPYLLAQAQVANMRLWRTPIIMGKISKETRLRAITPHGSLLGSADLQRYDYILGICIKSYTAEAGCEKVEQLKDKQSRGCDITGLQSLLAYFAGHHPVDLMEAANDTDDHLREKVSALLHSREVHNLLKLSTMKEEDRKNNKNDNDDKKLTKYASYNAKIVVSFLSGRTLTLSWSAYSNTQQPDIFKYPIEQIIEEKDEAPLLSYNAMLAELESCIDKNNMKDLDDLNAEHPQKHKILACIYVQKHSSELQSWAMKLSSKYLKGQCAAFSFQLAKVIDLRRPCIPFDTLISMSFGAQVAGDANCAGAEPKKKRLSDTEEWSIGIIRTIFPKELMQTLMKSTSEPKTSAELFIPSSDAGKALVERWKAEEQIEIKHLFMKKDALESAPSQAGSEYTKIISESTPALSDSALDNTGIDTQNIDFLVGLMKAA